MVPTRLIFAAALVAAAAFAAPSFAAGGPPLASTWNIAPTGNAGSSGDLAFRVTRGDGTDPVEITGPVMAGDSEDTVARSIRRVLSTQLPRARYSVRLGEGTNVLVSDPRGKPAFSLELLDSNIDNVRVAVQSVTPSAPPTVPTQSRPAEAPVPGPPANTVPGDASTPAIRVPSDTPPPGEVSPPPAVPPPASVPGPSPRGAPPPASIPPADTPAPPAAPPPNPMSPPPEGPIPPPNPAPPPNTHGGAGAPATAPPPVMPLPGSRFR